MEINFGEISINKILLKDLEKTNPQIINKVYVLATIKTMVPKNSKIAKQIDMLIVNYLCKSNFGSFLVPNEKIVSSRIYKKTITKLEKKYDTILEKDIIDDIFKKSCPTKYYMDKKILRKEDINQILGHSITTSREENLSILALNFSQLFVTSNYYNYNKDEIQILEIEEDRKHFLNNFKRAITGKKLKEYKSNIISKSR